MVYIVTSVRDTVSELFQGLNLEVNEESAKRNFKASIALAQEQRTGLLYTNPDNFALYKVGLFNSKSGTFDECPLTCLMLGDENV